jgi:hypothetical protein
MCGITEWLGTMPDDDGIRQSWENKEKCFFGSMTLII